MLKKHLPLIMLSLVVLAFVVTPFMPLKLCQQFLTLSYAVKELIILILPLLIFCLLLSTILRLSNQGTLILLTVVVLMSVSNFFTTLLAFPLGSLTKNLSFSFSPETTAQELSPLWLIKLGFQHANQYAIFLSIGVGCLIINFFHPYATIAYNIAENVTNKLVNFVLVLIPVFVFGFMVKISYDQVLILILHDYARIFLAITFASFVYLSCFLLIAVKGNLAVFLIRLRNSLPPIISGFTSMSSAVSMPLTMVAVENGARNKDVARSIVPITVNIHLLCDCITVPVLAFAISNAFHTLSPNFVDYLSFTAFFCIARFSVAAIPGGGIVVMLPLLELYFGFNSKMIALITTIYMLMDPMITAMNVYGNICFAKLFDALKIDLWLDKVFHKTKKLNMKETP